MGSSPWGRTAGHGWAAEHRASVLSFMAVLCFLFLVLLSVILACWFCITLFSVSSFLFHISALDLHHMVTIRFI